MEDQFLLPNGANRDAIRQMGYAFVDLIVDQVLAKQAGEFSQKFTSLPLTIPQTGRHWQDILQTIENKILPNTINLHHRGYMGHMDSVPLAITVWADALIAAINNNMLSYELSLSLQN